MHKRMETRKVPRGAQTRDHQGTKQVKLLVGGIMTWCDVIESGRARVTRPEWFGSVRMADGRIITHKLLRDKLSSERMLQDLQIQQDRIAAKLESAPTVSTEKLPQLLARFHGEIASRSGLAKSRQTQIRVWLGNMLKQLKIDRLDQLKILSPEMLAKWIDARIAENYSTGYVKLYLNNLTKFLKWLKSQNIIGFIPEFPTVKYTPTKIHRDLKQDEVNRLAKHAPWPRSIFYRMGFCTIARLGALLALVPEDLHLDDPAGPWVLFRKQHSKTKQAVRCPIPRDLVPDLKRLVRETPDGVPLFWQIHRGTIFYAFKSDLKRAGIPKETPEGTAVVHSLRHGGTTHLLEQGVQLSLVQEMGGWKSPKVLLAHYSHLSPMRNRAEIDRAMGAKTKSGLKRKPKTK